MVFEVILNCNSLDELLDSGSADEYPDTFGRKTHIERYRELAKKFAQFPVEMGAMQAAIKEWMDEIQEKSKDINKNENKEDRDREINKLFEDDPIIFLNRHDVSHTKKVMDRALELIKCFNRIDFSCYEIYFLLCAIVVHDVGNIYGRAGHEKKLAEILNNQCDNIIPDAIERRVISRIAGVHGGKIKGSSDTISVLNKTNTVNGFEIKEQLLAAILRFADELADDATRADYDALDNGIIGPASQIYHIYSEKLHTVALQKNKVTNAYEVYLAYNIENNATTEKDRDANMGYARLLKEMAAYFEQTTDFVVPSNNPYAAFKAMQEKLDAIGDKINVTIVPMNNKLSTLGVALIGLANPEIQICYAPALIYNTSSYSIPGDSCYLFSFEFPIKAKDCLEEVHDENNQSII